MGLRGTPELLITMSRHAPLTDQRVFVGTRVVESVSGSLRVTIPPPAIMQTLIADGDELRVGVTASGEVAFFPAGVPFCDDLVTYAGNTTVNDHNGSLKAVIREPADEEAGFEAGQAATFHVANSVIYVEPST